MCRTYAQEHGHEIVQVYHEVAISGKTEIERRTALPELIAAVKDRKTRNFDGVIVWRTDRLCRNPAEWHRVLSIFDKHKCELISVMDPVRRDTAANRLMTSIMADASAYEREVTGERIYAHHLASHLAGKWTGGPVCMGFKWDREAGVFKLDDRIGDVIAAFEAFVSCNGNAMGAAKALNRQGIRSPRGVHWSNHMVLSTINRPMYRQRISYDGRVIDAPAVVPESVPAALIAQAELLIEANKRGKRTPRQVGSTRPYSGIDYCSQCGGRMVAIYGGKYGSWACTHRRNHICDSVYVSSSFIDAMIAEAVQLLLEKLSEEIVSARKARRKPKGSDATAKSIERLQRQRELTVDTYTGGFISKEEFVGRITKIDEELAGLRAKRVQDPALAPVGSEILSAISTLATRWAEIPDEEKRGLLTQIGARATVNTSGIKPFYVDFTSALIPGIIRTEHNGRWAKSKG